MMTAAFWDVTREYEMEIQVRVSGNWIPLYTYYARAVSVDGPENQAVAQNRVTLGYERGFVVTLRMSSPKFYSVDEEVFSTGAIAPVAQGIIPPVIPPITIQPSEEGGVVTVFNKGTAPADPLLRIWGPITSPEVRNEAVPASLDFLGVSLLSGDFLDINFHTRQILLNGVSDYGRKRRGDWWDRGIPGLIPGNNRLKVFGTDVADPARMDILFKPARY
jgi:hypothetical protein